MTRTKQRSALVAFAFILVVALVTMVGGKGWPHTPGGGANCDKGYWVTAQSYESKDTNTIESKFDGVETKRNFQTSDSITGAWPQDGIEHTWSGYVHTSNSNQGYSKNYGPIKLTCGHKQDVKDASFSVGTTPASCDSQGSASVTSLVNATLVGQLDQTPGTHSASANSVPGHRFADNTSTATRSYTIEPKDVSQHCFVQPPDEHRQFSTKGTCQNPVITTTFQTRSYFWNGVSYVPGEWVTTDTVTTAVHVRGCIVNKHARANVHKIDGCNCFNDKVWLTFNPNKVVVLKSHPTKLTWKFTVIGLNTGNIQYKLPRHIGGSHGWATTQHYTFHTTNKKCPCHKTHTCHHIAPGSPPHCPVPGKLNGKPCHV